jgi:hypothetical protein
VTVKHPILYQCSICGRVLDTGTASEEKAGQFAAHSHWMLGLPGNDTWCPHCTDDLRYFGYVRDKIENGSV